MEDDPKTIYARHLLEDAANRIKWQHEFSLAGIRALVLINGGAVISLLTYIGNAPNHPSADRFASAFLWYIVGLVTTVASYLFAYYSQGVALDASMHQGLRILGLLGDPDAAETKTEASVKLATRLIFGAVVMRWCRFSGQDAKLIPT